MDSNPPNGLTPPQNAALDLTAQFMVKLHGNGMPAEQTIVEGYKFCQAALRGDTPVCARMDEAAAIVGRAAVRVGIHPKQVRGTWQGLRDREIET